MLSFKVDENINIECKQFKFISEFKVSIMMRTFHAWMNPASQWRDVHGWLKPETVANKNKVFAEDKLISLDFLCEAKTISTTSCIPANWETSGLPPQINLPEPLILAKYNHRNMTDVIQQSRDATYWAVLRSSERFKGLFLRLSGFKSRVKSSDADWGRGWCEGVGHSALANNSSL